MEMSLVSQGMVQEIDRARGPCVHMGSESDCYIRFSYSISNVLCTYEVKQNKRSNKYTETCLPLAQL
jgi:hypothetical protein